jgi:cyclic pyranopterin phosphate synthase
MLKMIDETMTIQNVVLVEKKGGKNDFKSEYETPIRAGIVVMSDAIAGGKKADISGKLIIERLTSEGVEAAQYLVIPDEEDLIVMTLKDLADEKKYDLVITTGGTGFSKRDCTPEAMQKVIDREIPGIPEAARAYGQFRTPFSMLSRGKAGIRKNTLIINLPGSKKGVAESLDALFPALLHSFKMMQGGGHTP